MPPKTSKSHIKELKALVKIMRANGISELKFNSIELKLDQKAFVESEKKTKKQKEIEKEFGTGVPKIEPWKTFMVDGKPLTDEQLATWSSAVGNPDVLEDGTVVSDPGEH